MELCRLCHLETPLSFSKNLFFNQHDHPSILEIVAKLTELTIRESDPFPRIVCLACYEKLMNFYSFRELVLNADLKFHNELDHSIEQCGIKTEENVDEYCGETYENDDFKVENDQNQVPSTDHCIQEHKTEETGGNSQINHDHHEDNDGNGDVIGKSVIDVEKQPTTSENECSICGKTFSQKGYLHVHLKVHTGEKPYECSICNKRFLQKVNLKTHLKVHNVKDKLFKCNLCDEEFQQKSNLYRHLKIHTDEKSYECSVCRNNFSSQSSLRRHLKVHAGDKPNECDICGKRFSRKEYVRLHMKTHTGEKPFECNVCGERFAQRPHLINHLNTHSGRKRYKCNLCDKRYTRKADLKYHLNTHTGENSYKCDNCDKCFAYKKQLNRHLKLHKL